MALRPASSSSSRCLPRRHFNFACCTTSNFLILCGLRLPSCLAMPGSMLVFPPLPLHTPPAAGCSAAAFRRQATSSRGRLKDFCRRPLCVSVTSSSRSSQSLSPFLSLSVSHSPAAGCNRQDGWRVSRNWWCRANGGQQNGDCQCNGAAAHTTYEWRERVHRTTCLPHVAHPPLDPS